VSRRPTSVRLRVSVIRTSDRTFFSEGNGWIRLCAHGRQLEVICRNGDPQWRNVAIPTHYGDEMSWITILRSNPWGTAKVPTSIHTALRCDPSSVVFWEFLCLHGIRILLICRPYLRRHFCGNFGAVSGFGTRLLLLPGLVAAREYGLCRIQSIATARIHTHNGRKQKV